MNGDTYYYPILFLIPDFSEQEVERPPVRLAKRRWITSTFDLATLATKHKLNLPYQVIDVFLSHCNLELCLNGQSSIEQANATFEAFRLGLYASGISPFIAPFITTHSINDYSGINSRDSDLLRDSLPPGMKEGVRSGEAILEAWPFELSLKCIVLENGLKISEKTLIEAVEKATAWIKLVEKYPTLRPVQDVVNSAHLFLWYHQSLLHLWSAIESLFPGVSTELSFRIAVYLAQLIGSRSKRLEWFEKVRAAYNLRSKITHGSRQEITEKEWHNTWLILMGAINSVISRESLPSEKELIKELLS